MKLSEEQRKAILHPNAAYSADWNEVSTTPTDPFVQVTEDDVLRALRVVAVLDGLDEEQIGCLLDESAASEHVLRSAIATEGMFVSAEVIARWTREAEANRALARALEVLRG